MASVRDTFRTRRTKIRKFNMTFAIQLAERGLFPDRLIRMGIRSLLAARRRNVEEVDLTEFANLLRQSPLAVDTDAANRQHYEVPAEFFAIVLGPRLKYSCCLFEQPSTFLAEAEDAMLRLTCERAEIANGMRILELGCGWGSLTLWLAEHYPNCQITAVSNSSRQRQFIAARAAERQLTNIEVITADMRDFASTEQFDRVVSVEMFEHMRNYALLFERVSNWLVPEGKAFVHVFCHRSTPYLFETEGANNWMGRHFFTGGIMPSADLFNCFRDHLHISRQWRVGGLHYWRTCEAWLQNADDQRHQILARFELDLSPREARLQLQRWRMFFMACAELFRYRDGNEWFVEHYLLEPSREFRPRDRDLRASVSRTLQPSPVRH